MSKVLTLDDFSDNLRKGFVGEELTAEKAENQIIENFQKGQISEEIFLSGMNTLDRLEKGKRGNVGEIRTWGNGKKYQKTADGWKPVKETKSDKPSTSTDKNLEESLLKLLKEAESHAYAKDATKSRLKRFLKQYSEYNDLIPSEITLDDFFEWYDN